MLRSALAVILALFLAAPDLAVHAQQTASAPAILSVRRHGEPSVEFDRAALARLPQRAILTSTPWTEGTITFEGPLLRDVLRQAGSRGTTITAIAINEYKVNLPFSDAEAFDVIVALKRDGQYMPVRDKGPLWIVYPLDQVAELRTPGTHAKMIWQLKAMLVE